MDHPTWLPYYADSASLPAALPTEAQMLGSKDILLDSFGRKIVRVGHHFLVKYGTRIDSIEAENTMFVQRNTKIPVPKVYAVFASGNDEGVIYMIMEYIHGSTLQSEWPAMSKWQKDSVCRQLRSYFEELRHIPSPSYYGNLDHRPFDTGMFWAKGGAKCNPAISGPFETENALNEAFVQKSKLIDLYNNRPGYKADFYHRSLPSVFQGHQPVFTHGDFQPKNIMLVKILAETEGGANTVEDYQVTLIDWESSGWYPTYWEYCLAAMSFRWEDDWPSSVEDILLPYRMEFPWMYMLYHELL